MKSQCLKTQLCFWVSQSGHARAYRFFDTQSPLHHEDPLRGTANVRQHEGTHSHESRYLNANQKGANASEVLEWPAAQTAGQAGVGPPREVRGVPRRPKQSRIMPCLRSLFTTSWSLLRVAFLIRCQPLTIVVSSWVFQCTTSHSGGCGGLRRDLRLPQRRTW